MKQTVCIFLVFLLALSLTLPVLASEQGSAESFFLESDEFDYYEDEDPFYGAEYEQTRKWMISLQFALFCVLPSLGGIVFSLVRLFRSREGKFLWTVLLLLLCCYLACYTAFFVFIF